MKAITLTQPRGGEGPRARVAANPSSWFRPGGIGVCPAPNLQPLAPALRWVEVMRRLAWQNPAFVLQLAGRGGGSNPAPKQHRVFPQRPGPSERQIGQGVRV